MFISLEPNRLSFDEVLSLLNRCDNSFDPPLSSHIDLQAYARRMSDNALFVLIKNDEGDVVAFTAYYLNQEGAFAYIPEIWVADSCQRMGLGHKMIAHLGHLAPDYVKKIRLEVRKNNEKAYHFYMKEGFVLVEDRNTKVLFEKSMQYEG